MTLLSFMMKEPCYDKHVLNHIKYRARNYVFIPYQETFNSTHFVECKRKAVISQTSLSRDKLVRIQEDKIVQVPIYILLSILSSSRILSEFIVFS